MSVKINNRTFARGDVVTFNSKAYNVCYAPEGLKVLIHVIKNDGMVGLYSPDQRIENWSDLDGEVGHHRGWWLETITLGQIITEDDSPYEIIKSTEHRGVQLKGKACRRLANLDDGHIFVEFEEDVNGCSADGLGKSGHCVAVNANTLKLKKKKEKHAK